MGALLSGMACVITIGTKVLTLSIKLNRLSKGRCPYVQLSVIKLLYVELSIRVRYLVHR